MTPQQLYEITKWVDIYTLKFINQYIGKHILTPADIKLLKEFEISLEIIQPYVQNAYKFGILTQVLGQAQAKKLQYNDIIKNLNKFKLDGRESQILYSVENFAYNEIKGLGNKIKADINREVLKIGNISELKKYVNIEASPKQRKKLETTIKNTSKEAVNNKMTVAQLASELGHKTENWARDWDRVADYILNTAHQEGLVSEGLNLYGADAEGYKIVYEEACKTCNRVYKNKDGSPKVFKITDLILNGSNIGRKGDELKATVAPVHPRCRCELVVLPPNSVWNKETKQFELKANKDSYWYKYFNTKIKEVREKRAKEFQ